MVHLFLDNATTVTYITHQEGTGSVHLECEITSLLAWVEDNLLTLSVAHVAGKDNVAANFLSQHHLNPGKWTLNTKIFALLVQCWGASIMDLRVSKNGSFLQQEKGVHVRWPGCVSAALAHRGAAVCVFPSWMLIDRMVQRI